MTILKRVSMKGKTSEGSRKPPKIATAPATAVDRTEGNHHGESNTVKTSLHSDVSLSSDDASSSKSYVSIVEGSIVVARVDKPNQHAKAGISLTKDESTNSIMIVAVAEGGLLATSKLRPGQKVLSINGTVCPKETAEAARLIAETPGTLTIGACEVVKPGDPTKETGKKPPFSEVAAPGLDDSLISAIDNAAEIESVEHEKLSSYDEQMELSHLRRYNSLATVAMGAVLIGAGTIARASLSRR